MGANYEDTSTHNSGSTKPHHQQVQRRSISLTLAELLMALLLVWFVSFAGGYWLSRIHAIDYYGPAFDKLETKHTLLLEDFAKLETRMGLLEGKGQRRGWR